MAPVCRRVLPRLARSDAKWKRLVAGEKERRSQTSDPRTHADHRRQEPCVLVQVRRPVPRRRPPRAGEPAMTLDPNRTMDEAAAWLGIGRRTLQEVIKRHRFISAPAGASCSPRPTSSRSAPRSMRRPARRRRDAAQARPATAGESPCHSVRGTHCGVYLDRSTKLVEEGKAARLPRKWEGDIERGQLARPGEPTFLDAAVLYLKSGATIASSAHGTTTTAAGPASPGSSAPSPSPRSTRRASTRGPSPCSRAAPRRHATAKSTRRSPRCCTT